MKHARLVIVVWLLFISVSAYAQVSAVPPLLNFQGRLTKPDGTPVADGTYSVRFSLWNASGGSTEKWNQTVSSVNVKNGVFAVLLSGFSNNTFQSNLWLQIQIGTDTPLTPRQQLVSVAYAMKADSVKDGAITGSSIANGTITAAKLASGLFNPLAWHLGGNSGTNGTQFLGTTDNQPLEFRVNNWRNMQMQYVVNGNYHSNNVLGGYWFNSVTEGVTGATIFGGITKFSLDYPNRVTDHGGTVSGGVGNRAGNDDSDVTNAYFATVGGGELNTARGYYATVGGGYVNTAIGNRATVGGGFLNDAGSSATVGGGAQNTASGIGSTVGGGFYNAALGNYAMIPGGSFNNASGQHSFAAGSKAKAYHDGAFVWADGSADADFASTGSNQFLIRATEGVGIGNNNPAHPLDIAGRLRSRGIPSVGGGGIWFSTSASPTNDRTYIGRSTDLDAFTGFYSVPAARWNFYVADMTGNATLRGTLTQNSDVRLKKDITTLDNALDAILNLRGVTYAWKEEGRSTGKQIGFLAQEVEQVLPELVSTDNKGYKSVAYQNVVPVLVEAVKQQQKQQNTLRAEVTDLKAENAQLKARLAAIEERLSEHKAQKK